MNFDKYEITLKDIIAWDILVSDAYLIGLTLSEELLKDYVALYDTEDIIAYTSEDRDYCFREAKYIVDKFIGEWYDA